MSTKDIKRQLLDQINKKASHLKELRSATSNRRTIRDEIIDFLDKRQQLDKSNQDVYANNCAILHSTLLARIKHANPGIDGHAYISYIDDNLENECIRVTIKWSTQMRKIYTELNEEEVFDTTDILLRVMNSVD